MTASTPRGPELLTFKDLFDLPEDGQRYELIDGRLLVSPMAAVPHYRVLTLLQELLMEQRPAHFAVGQNGGILDGARNTYLIPDLMVTPRHALKSIAGAFSPADAVLVVEVLSPSSHENDYIIKRRYYARMGIPHYWIVDPMSCTLHVMRLAESGLYFDVANVGPGEEWSTDVPFPIVLAPASFC